VPLSRNLGILTSWNILGTSGTVTGLLYSYLYIPISTHGSRFLRKCQSVVLKGYVKKPYWTGDKIP